jgi:dihydrofolate reductase
MFNIIVAMCKKSRGIGLKNGLPFYIPKDLVRFKDLTIGGGNNSVIMGSKTWLSLPVNKKPLRKRENIVLSRKPKVFDLSGKGYLLNNIELLPIFCKNMKYDENWIIGGSEIYKKSLEMGIVKKVYITEIHEEHECDSYFPELNYEYFELNSSVEDECDGVRLTNKIFCKKLKKS